MRKRKSKCRYCNNHTESEDYDTPAVCSECSKEEREDIACAQAWNEQNGAQWLGHDRGTRDRFQV